MEAKTKKIILWSSVAVLVAGGAFTAIMLLKPSKKEEAKKDKGKGKPKDDNAGGTRTETTAPAGKSLEELNPANKGRLIYAKQDNPYIILANGQVDTSKKKGDYIGLLPPPQVGGGRGNVPAITTSTQWKLTNGMTVYATQVMTDAHKGALDATSGRGGSGGAVEDE